jgi:hypothetical protein
LDEPERDLNIPARDQVKLKGAKPTPAGDLTGIEHVTIEEERAKLADVKQGPPVEVEKMVPHADQVQLRQKFQTKKVEPGEPVRIDSEPLKDTPPVVKQLVFWLLR